MMNEPKIKLEDTRELTCECGHALFKQAITMREISSLMSGTGKVEIVPLAIIVCEKCNKQFEKSKIIT
jgi:hypothetical protein